MKSISQHYRPDIWHPSYPCNPHQSPQASPAPRGTVPDLLSILPGSVLPPSQFSRSPFPRWSASSRTHKWLPRPLENANVGCELRPHLRLCYEAVDPKLRVGFAFFWFWFWWMRGSSCLWNKKRTRVELVDNLGSGEDLVWSVGLSRIGCRIDHWWVIGGLN